MPWYVCPKRLLAEGGPDDTVELLAPPAAGPRPAALQPIVGGPLPPDVLPVGGLLELPPPCPSCPFPPVGDGGEEPPLLGGPELPLPVPLPGEGLLGLPPGLLL